MVTSALVYGYNQLSVLNELFVVFQLNQVCPVRAHLRPKILGLLLYPLLPYGIFEIRFLAPLVTYIHLVDFSVFISSQRHLFVGDGNVDVPLPLCVVYTEIAIFVTHEPQEIYIKILPVLLSKIGKILSLRNGRGSIILVILKFH